MRITIFPMGSRGDVQPYVALGIGLKRAGYEVTIPVDSMFRDLVSEAGLEFREMRGASPQEFFRDPEIQAAVLQGNGKIRVLAAFLRKAGTFIQDIVEEVWKHSQDADAVIATIMPWGILDAAEKRGIPAIWAPLHPMHPTRAFPSPMINFGKARYGHPLNPLSFHIVRQMMWQFLRSTINQWRRTRLNLPPLPFDGPYRQMHTQRLPMIYGFSEHILPRPTDWPEWHQVAGWWFMNEPDGWQPPDALARFLEAGSPPVYIGFGSMDDQRPERIVEIAIKALEISGQRGILQSGWMQMHSIDLPASILHIDPLPHSWLFPRMAAVVHHGGAGTMAAGLRAGVPTIIIPLAFDQLFWAQRVAELGVGLSPASFYKITPEALASAVTTAVNDTELRQRAAALGTSVRAENGVGCAVGLIQQILADS